MSFIIQHRDHPTLQGLQAQARHPTRWAATLPVIDPKPYPEPYPLPRLLPSRRLSFPDPALYPSSCFSCSVLAFSPSMLPPSLLSTALGGRGGALLVIGLRRLRSSDRFSPLFTSISWEPPSGTTVSDFSLFIHFFTLPSSCSAVTERVGTNLWIQPLIVRLSLDDTDA